MCSGQDYHVGHQTMSLCSWLCVQAHSHAGTETVVTRLEAHNCLKCLCVVALMVSFTGNTQTQIWRHDHILLALQLSVMVRYAQNVGHIV